MSRPGPRPEVSDDELLAVLREHDHPVLTAGEIADRVSIGRRAVHDRLVDLHERGRVERKDIGPRTVWWAVDGDSSASDPTEGDQFFDAPTFASGESTTARDVDEVLYGPE